MAERIHPSSKPQPLNPPPKAPNPSSKAQLYGAPRPRPVYRQHPRHHRHRRSCCCACFLWTTFILFILLILVAIAGLGFWVVYQPQLPSFAVKSIQVTQFTIKRSALHSKIELAISTRNPNRKLVFIYNPITVLLRSSHGIDVGNGSFLGFVHGAKSTKDMKALVSSGQRELDSDSEESLETDLKKNGLALEIELQTKVKVKVASVESDKVSVRVVCEGIQVRRSGGSRVKASGNAKCKVGMEFKIWRWSFGFNF